GATNVKICAYLPSIELEVVPADSRVSVAVAAFDPMVDMGNSENPTRKRSETLRLYVEREKRRTQPRFIPPQAKVSANYLSPMLAKWKAREKGYDDILLLDDDGNLTEAPTSNVFLVDQEGVLRTPSTEFVLEGVTRSGVIEVAKRDGFEVCEERISGDEVFRAREVFLTTTSQGVWPVESIDGKPVGGEGAECPGPVSRALRERFKKVERGEDPEFIHWLTFVDEEN
ncbi:MAG: aminotransferase class IV, partial [Deltaproteobacteria bacterium]|nr:aminotransferase class IV [Deltaproteobacteria bacterium]